MAIDFPSNPSLDAVFTDPTSAKSWKWDGSKWVNVTALTAADIPSASIDSTKLNVAASGSTGDVLTRNTAAASGFGWSSISYPWTTYSPTWTQSATISRTINFARYSQIDKTVYASISLSATSAGTSGQLIRVSLPVTASSSNILMGTALLSDAGTYYPLCAYYDTSTLIKFVRLDTTPTSFFSTVQIASGDQLFVTLQYEAA